MTVGPLDWLLQHSHNYPLLTPEQEIIYSRHVQEWVALRDKDNPTKREQAVIRRGKRAYDRFFLSNIRMVVHLAQRYRRFVGTLTLDDMTQEGLIGLERAIVKFDATRGYKFSTYAFNWIRQSINRAISNKSRMIRLPDNAIVVIKKAYDFINEHRRLTGKRPSMEEIAAHCNVSLHTLKGYLPHGAPVISLDEQCSNSRDDSSALLDLIADENHGNDLDEYDGMENQLEHVLSELGQIDRYIIERLYYQPDGVRISLNTIASEVGISRQAVTQRHHIMMRKMRLKLNQPAAQPDTQEQLYAAWRCG